MQEQVFQLATQYKYAVLRVILFSFSTMIVFFGVIIICMGILPESWMIPTMMLLSIPLIIFLSKYTVGFGKYESIVKIDAEAMRVAPLFEEYNEKVYPWSDLKEFRSITMPPHVGFKGDLYIKWHNQDSQHFSGEQMVELYQFLLDHFPKKEWRFLGAPKRAK